VQAKIRLVHRRHRVAAHRGVTIDPEGLARDRREQVPEYGVASQRGRPDDDGHERGREHALGHVDRAPDGSDLRRRVERRAELVVGDGRAERAQALEDARQLGLHLGRRPRAAHAGDAHRTHARKARQILGRGRREEQHGPQPGADEHVHDVRGPGEVVAVERQQQRRRAHDRAPK
jgi:hypothetical protein